MAGYPHNRKVADALERALARAFPNPSGRRYSALLMLSGGLDSVALLANVLAGTDHQLHVHHLEIRNRENRAEAENEAVSRVLAYCREHYREFASSSSVSDFPIGLGGGLDVTLTMFTAARVHTALEAAFDIVYTGHVTSPPADILEAAAVFNACYINRRFKPKWIWPLARMNKRDVYESIPPGLAALTWSCRRPVYRPDGSYERCGNCHACHSLAGVGGRPG